LTALVFDGDLFPGCTIPAQALNASVTRFSGPKQQDHWEQHHNQHPRKKAGGHDSVVKWGGD